MALPGWGRFRALSLGELLDSAFSLYRRNVLLIVSITAVVQVPAAVLTLVVYQLTGYAARAEALQRLAQATRGASPERLNQLFGSSLATLIPLLIIGGVVALVQWLVIEPLATAAMTGAVSDLYLGRRSSLWSAYRGVLRRLAAVLGVTALLLLAGIGAIAAVVALVTLLGLALGPAGAGLGVLLVPGAAILAAIAFTRLTFAMPAVIIERCAAVEALRRSWGLVRGSTGRIFGILLLVTIITGVITALLTGLLQVGTQFGDAATRLVLQQLVALVATVLVQPVTLIVVVLLYYDQRIRREAFDIEMLASTL